MKRHTLLFGVALALLAASWTSVASAMPSDTESATYQMKNSMQSTESLPFALGFGASGDFVLDRSLDNDTDLEASWYGMDIFIDPVDRLHFDLFLGAADFNLGGVAVDGHAPTTKAELDTETTFAVGGSGKLDIVDFAVFPDQPNSWIYTTAGYRWANPDVDDATSLGRAANLSMDVDVSEWQVGLGWQQRFNNLVSGIGFVSYFGVQYSDISVDLNGTGVYPAIGIGPQQTIVTDNSNSEDAFGVFVGCQIWGSEDRLMIGVEGRFISETAVSVNGHFRW